MEQVINKWEKTSKVTRKQAYVVVDGDEGEISVGSEMMFMSRADLIALRDMLNASVR